MRNAKGQFVKVTRTTLRPITKGKNARDVCAHKKTKLSKGAKRQSPPSQPSPVTAYRMRFDRA